MTANASSAERSDGGERFLTAAVVADPVRYRRWRAGKLARARRCLAQPPVDIADPARLTGAELAALRARVEAVNFAFYRIAGGALDHAALKLLCRQAGLARLAVNPFAAASGISEICVTGRDSAAGDDAAAAKNNAPARRAYIPYTDRALAWHTDGYYNPPARRIHAFALHTLRAAPSGGENQLLDHEILYLLLRDRDPALAACLFAADALSIPPGIEAGKTGGATGDKTVEARPAQTGPVFYFAGDRLQMRLTLRPRHAHWQSPQARTAVAEIKAILAAPETPLVVTRRLRAGEGILCNNVPHNRAAFAGPRAGRPGRLVLRARFYERINIGARRR